MLFRGRADSSCNPAELRVKKDSGRDEHTQKSVVFRNESWKEEKQGRMREERTNQE